MKCQNFVKTYRLRWKTLEQGKRRLFKVIEEQLSKGLEDLTKVLATELVIAYEPVWAVGTGSVPDSG